MADGTTAGEATEDTVAAIGRTAGLIWNYLHEHGSVSVTKLAKDVDVPRDLVLHGLGWLAREDKIDFVKVARSRTVRLK